MWVRTNLTSFVGQAKSSKVKLVKVWFNQEPEITRLFCSSTEMNIDGVTFVPEKGFYQPSTEETWEAYQALLSIIADYARGSPPVVMYSLADEVLSVLKSPNLWNIIDKKSEIDNLISPRVPMSYHIFEQLVLIGHNITNYVSDHLDEYSSGTNMMDGLFNPEKEFYQPRTEHTLMIYKMLLNIVDNQLGFQQCDTGCFIANEVLAILKNKNIDNVNIKRDSIEKLLSWISDETFDMLMYIERGITDYQKCDEDDPSTSSKRTKQSDLEATTWGDFDRIKVSNRDMGDFVSDFHEKLVLSQNDDNVEFEFVNKGVDEDGDSDLKIINTDEEWEFV
ncbi:hypothetical protein GIB67_008716 [Kingdonia uniflora]|uniref:Uncharacterized protein n=1 Tax=Kingdonia uniflora TaxID=39325 RepID=A0A7J7NHB4_9MAGN|nr:hypothetical protein GIB67_008716 [Kingdonia uniflora]